MQAILTIASQKLDLDANTVSQIRFRNKANTCTTQLNPKVKKRNESFSDFEKSDEPPILPVEDLIEEKKCEAEDLILTPKSDESPSNLAKKAAGWGGEDSKDKDQLKILTGMGISASNPEAVMG
jgi:hypothetical protein